MRPLAVSVLLLSLVARAQGAQEQDGGTAVVPESVAPTAPLEVEGAALEPEPAAAPSAVWSVAPKAALPPLDLSFARALYDARCRQCHGQQGRGDGAAARYLDPAPRDLSQARYKFRSTGTGELPTRLDLFESISRGMAGTGMPAWRGLPEASRWQLVLLLESFSPRFSEERPEKVLAVGVPPVKDLSRLQSGRAVYERLGCAKCHGEDGRGQGPEADRLRDEQGAPIHPFNLTRGENYRGGCRPSQIYRTIVTGLGGPPMPAFADALSSDETWNLVFFLESLFIDSPACGSWR